MTKTKMSAKKAFVMSVLSLLLCLAMLLGTTFAWFTDEVTSSENKIVSGTLDIDLLVKGFDEEAPDTYVSVAESKEAIFDYSLWEPGYTEFRNIKVVNKGTLALKYTLSIVVTPDSDAQETEKLADVIDVYYAPAEVTKENAGRALEGLTRLGTLSEVIDGKGGKLVINDNMTASTGDTEVADYATVVLKMRESAGNEYQDLSVGGSFDLRLLATQFTYENDSFDDQYDADAAYPVVTADALAQALASGGTVKLDADIIAEESIVVPAGVSAVIDLNGKTISSAITGAPAILNSGELTIDGNGTVTNSISNSVKNEGTLIINGGTYTAGSYALNNSGGTLIVNSADAESAGGIYTSGGTLNIKDGDFIATSTSRHGIYAYNSEVIVDGGSFGHKGTTSTVMLAGTTTMTINDGTFTVADGYYLFDFNGTPVLNINGGELTGMTRFISNGTTNISGGVIDLLKGTYVANTAALNITGGTFKTFDPTKYVVDGYSAIANGDSWTVNAN